MVAGLDLPTEGVVTWKGNGSLSLDQIGWWCSRIIRCCLGAQYGKTLPLAVNSVMKDLPAGERKGIVEHHIDMGLRHAATSQLSCRVG